MEIELNNANFEAEVEKSATPVLAAERITK